MLGERHDHLLAPSAKHEVNAGALIGFREMGHKEMGTRYRRAGACNRPYLVLLLGSM